MAKNKISYLCNDCGYSAPSYLGRCPECQSWNSFVEQVSMKPKTDTLRTRSLIAPGDANGGVVRLSDVTMETLAQYTTGFPEVDRVLGGGIMPGGYVLIGGDPGIGKSTLMLQMADQVGRQGKMVLYVAGEESPYQIKMRAERLGVDTTGISVLAQTNIQQVMDTIRQVQPDLVVVDSIQAMYCADVSGTPGSVSQIKECAAILMEVAKGLNIPIFLVGHVTKEGAVSGPKLLEHTVDAVLYFEGDKYQNLRILRTVKNRFGSTQEIGVFEMAEVGLKEISNPSELFLSQNAASGIFGGHPGSAVAATLEGSRPILVEIQALVGQSAYSTPRRIGNGVEHNRLHQIVAVLERRLGLDFSRQDVYVNVVGGLRIDEPAADLAIAVAIISSARNISVVPGTVMTGEIGLTGEIRPVRQCQNRLQEAVRIGFQCMIVPDTPNLELPSEKLPDGRTFKTLPVQTIADTIRNCFDPASLRPEAAPDREGVRGKERPPKLDVELVEG